MDYISSQGFLPPKRQREFDQAIVSFRFEKAFVHLNTRYANLCALRPENVDDEALKSQLILRDQLIAELKEECTVSTQKVNLIFNTLTLDSLIEVFRSFIFTSICMERLYHRQTWPSL